MTFDDINLLASKRIPFLFISDFKAQNFTTILDHRFTDVKQNKMIKLVIWYDNEWGYSCRLVDMAVHISKK